MILQYRGNESLNAAGEMRQDKDGLLHHPENY